MYNEPHLRTDADLSVTPALWVPATDFSEAFHYEDLRDSGKNLIAKKVIYLGYGITDYGVSRSGIQR